MLHQGGVTLSQGRKCYIKVKCNHNIQCKHSEQLANEDLFPAIVSLPRKVPLQGKETTAGTDGRETTAGNTYAFAANNQFEPSIPIFNLNSRFENTIAFDSSIKCWNIWLWPLVPRTSLLFGQTKNLNPQCMNSITAILFSSWGAQWRPIVIFWELLILTRTYTVY